MKFFLILAILTSTIFAKPISVKEKKEHFKALVIPAVNKVYLELQNQYIEMRHYIGRDHKYYRQTIAKMRKEYNASSNEELLKRLKPHPRSIAIAQAAMESAWATSRFYREANNIFGVWSFNKNEPRIAAGKKRGSRTIWLKKYYNIEESIRDYYKTLAKGRAFISFRNLKMKTNDPYKLVKTLDKYSELGSKYAKKLSQVIRYNKFYLYDK